MGSRTWIKIYCDKWLEKKPGSIANESLAVQALWVKLLALTGSGRYGDTGEIKLAEGIGLTDKQIAAILGISEEIWLIVKQGFSDAHRISVSETNTILITNWSKYQSEYERVRKYTAKTTEKTTEKYHRENRIEENRIDKNRKEEKRKNRKKKNSISSSSSTNKDKEGKDVWDKEEAFNPGSAEL